MEHDRALPSGLFLPRHSVCREREASPADKFGTALETASTSGDTATFKPVPFNTLVDSPMIAGAYFERLDLDPNGVAPVHFDIVADKPGEFW